MGASDKGPEAPTYISSWSQYTSIYGGWNSVASNVLPLAVYMFFTNGGSGAYINRVTGSGAAAATRTLNDTAGTPHATLVVSASSKGSWGTNINVSVTASTITGYFNLTVYYGGTTSANIVERWTDITMDTTNARYAVSTINAGSTYITVADGGSTASGATRNPAVAANTTLTGSGLDGGSITNSTFISDLNTDGTSAWDGIKQTLILNIPGYTDAATVNAAIAYAEYRTDVFVVVDGLNDTVTAQLAAAATYTVSSRAAVYYPQITIPDPTAQVGSSSGLTKTIGAGGAVVGLYAATDASRGVFKAPAGLQAKIAGAVSVPSLTNTDLDNLNTASAPVNAIKYTPGAGIVVMGARTLKQGYVDRYVPVRRTLIYLEKSLTDLTQFAVFEPNDARLWRRLNASVSSFLTGFWNQGGLAGASPSQAFFVKVDSENNPQASIDNGYVTIEVGVALQRPAEYVVIKIGQFDGGTTVTVA
jgi:hypothetical protein